MRDEGRDAEPHQLGRGLRLPLDPAFGVPRLQDDGLALDVAQVAQAVAEGVERGGAGGGRPDEEDPDPRYLRLPRLGGQGPAPREEARARET